MSVIIRLQNLPWSANALDIRNYFRGLSIPEGGVHIVGGEMGDAFIAFSTDEDARQAMLNDLGKIKEVQVKLLLSSRAEMQKVIEAARQQTISYLQIPPQPPVISSTLSSFLTQSMKKDRPMDIDAPNVIPSSVELKAEEPKNDNEKRDSKAKDDRRDRRDKDKDRTRSRSRDRRDRRDRSRSRDRRRDRRRDKSRSRDRRDKRKDRRDRSKDRSREVSRDKSKERERDKDRKPRDAPKKDDDVRDPKAITSPPIAKPPPPVWDVTQPSPIPTPQQLLANTLQRYRPDINPQPTLLPGIRPLLATRTSTGSLLGPPPSLGSALPAPIAGLRDWMALNKLNRMPNNDIPNNGPGNLLNSSTLNVANHDQLNRLQNLEGRRNPTAFQSNLSVPFSAPRTGSYNHHNDHSNRRQSSNNLRCVQAANLPLTAGYSDVRRFFLNLHIPNNGIKMINDNNGRRTGVVYVRFATPEIKPQALALSGEFLRDNKVIVSSIDDETYDEAVDGYRPSDGNHQNADSDTETEGELQIVDNEVTNDKNNVESEESTVLKLEDLPPFAREQDVMKVFSDYALMSIIMVVTKELRKQYLAYVQFHNAADAADALKNKSKHIIGHKVIKASVCRMDVFVKVRQEHGDGIPELPAAPNPKVEPQIVLSMNTPLKDPRQRQINENLGMINNKLPALMDRKQLPLPSSSLLNFNTMLGSGSRLLMPGTLGGMMNRDIRGRGGGGLLSRNSYDRAEDVTQWVILTCLPSRTTDRDVMDFFSDVGLVPNKVHLALNQFGESAGDCFCEFSNHAEALRAVSKNNMPMGMSPVNVKLIAKAKVEDALGCHDPLAISHMGGGRGGLLPFHRRGRGFGPTRGGFNNRGDYNRLNNAPMGGFGPDDSSCEGFGAPGCVLALENVPFRAGIEEILEFFSDFKVSRDNVIRRFNDSGHPTGDARVAFATPQEAQKALESKTAWGGNCKIRDRKIYVSLA